MYRDEERILCFHHHPDICVAVPVEFGAVATVGDAFVNCNEVSEDDICTGCDQIPTAAPSNTPRI